MVISFVEKEGDEAVLDYTRKFDCPDLTSLVLSQENIDALAAKVTPEVASAIDTAFNNIKMFHEAQMPSDIALTTTPGVKCELRFTALDAVGLYIPGGSAHQTKNSLSRLKLRMRPENAASTRSSCVVVPKQSPLWPWEQTAFLK